MAGEPSSRDSIFCSAIEIASAEERAAYIAQACANDLALRQAVEKLVAAHFRAGSFLEQAAPSPVATVEEARVSEAAGTVIGPYKLIEQIGEGGMGTVWMAQQTEPVKRLVALKLIKAGMDSKQVIARFEAERQALALMDHPNIARVLDGGTTPPSPPSQGGAWGGGRPYFVMDLVKGVPITRYCDEHHLTPRQRLELFVPVCQAVQHAHQKGIIHRDLKPSNVLVALYDGKPVPKVIDFGVAKAAGQSLTEKTLVTGFGNIVGTLEYMSPEQAEVNQLDIDTRSDIYSLGVLLYELLAGSPPFSRKELEKAGMLEMLRVIREEEPSKPSTKLSTAEGLPTLAANRGTEPAKLTKLVRGELDWIVMKALEKDRNRRYETANGFAADVQRYLADEPVLACPPSVGYRLRKFARRNKAPLAIAGLVAGGLLLAVVGLAVSNRLISDERDEKVQALDAKGKALVAAETNFKEAKRQEKLANDNAATAEKQRLHAVAQEKLAKEQTGLAHHRLYASQMNLAFLAREQGNPARALDLLEGLRPKPGEADLRGFEWYCLWHLCHSGRRLVLRGHSRVIRAVAFSPDGTQLASCGPDGTARVWDAATGRVIRVLRSRDGGFESLAYAPDGRTIVAGGSNGTIHLWDTGTGKLRATWRGHGAQTDLAGPHAMVWSVAISADGKLLVSGGQDRAVKLWEAATHKPLGTLGELATPVLSVAVAPDGKTVAAAGWSNNHLKVWDTATRAERLQLSGSRPLTFLPDGTLVARWSIDSLVLWDLATGKERQRVLTAGSPDTSVSLAASSDGKLLGFGGRDRNVWLWTVADGKLRANHGRLATIEHVALSPDGRLVASASDDRVVEVWDVAPRPDPVHLANIFGYLRFSPDSKTLFTASNQHVYAWEAATGRQLAAKKIAGSNPVVSPDGKQVAAFAGRVLKVWDVAAEREIAALAGDKPELPESQGRAAFSPDGRTLAEVGPGRTLRLWDLAKREARRVIRLEGNFRGEANFNQLAYAPDGRTLAVAGWAKALELRDAETGRRTTMLRPTSGEHYESIDSVAFSPDGKTLASGGTAGLLELWDVESGKRLHVLRGHTAQVNALAFAPDGKTLASGGENVRFWDPETGQERATLSGTVGMIRSLAFAPDGSALAVASADGVRIWHTAAPEEPPADVLDELQALQAREAADPDRAVAGYSALIARAPKVAEVWAARGAYHLREGDFGKAAEDYSRALELKSDEWWWWHERALCDAARGEHKKAVAGYTRAIALADSDAGQWLRRGDSYRALCELAKAEEDYTRAIELDPQVWEAWSGRAFVHFGRQHWGKAVADFSRAIDLAPGVHTNWWHRGHVYLNLKEWDKAAADFGTVVERWPDEAEGWYLRGVAFAQLKQPDKAVADLRQAIAKGFKHVEWLGSDTRLDPLRSNEDFKKLRALSEKKEK